MSSTNRSNARDSHVSDFYVTPIKPIQDFFNRFIEDYNIHTDNLKILDPCSGGDRLHPSSYEKAIELPIDKIDIREDSIHDINADFLTLTPTSLNYLLEEKYEWSGNQEKEYDIVITNPPFNIAEKS